MSFRILGPLAVMHGASDITPTAPKMRQVLAFLLVRSNQLIQVSEFIDELWADNPPESSMTTLQTYIYKLRKDVLGPSGLANLETRPSGYRLYLDDESLDAFDFERLLAQGRMALEGGDPESASQWLSQALALWQGQALGGVTTGEILSAYVTRLEEGRLRALEMRIQADMLLGRYQEIIGELKSLTSRYPLHEHFHADLMTALHKSGRRYEALNVYQRLRKVLIDAVGHRPAPSPVAADRYLPAAGREAA